MGRVCLRARIVALGAGCVASFEDARKRCRRDSRTIVLDVEKQFHLVIRTCLAFAENELYAPSAARHGLNRVLHEIDEDTSEIFAAQTHGLGATYRIDTDGHRGSRECG